MTRPNVCAAPGCGAALVPSAGRGRPRIYCSPRCRARAVVGGGRLTVEVDHEPVDEGAPRPVGRVWLVRLRRGRRTVVVAAELGRPSADHLAAQVADVISPRRPRAEGAAME